jgi:hypothetical protein
VPLRRGNFFEKTLQHRFAGADTEGVPGTLHQGLLALFQEDPWLAFDILGISRPVGGTPIDRRAEIEREGKKPWTLRQGYPDLVFVHRDPAKKRRGIVITVEAQKDYESGKRWMIPVYQSHLAHDHKLSTWAVVVSLDERMSRRLRAWREGDPPKVDVLLLDVEAVSLRWLDDPAQCPMAAVLAGTLHGYAGDLDAARRAFQFTRTMTGDRRQRHGMTILAALPQHQRDQLIEELPMEEQHSWMDVERRSGTYQFGVKEGLQQGLERGLEQGREQGLEQGLEQGREQGRMVLLELLFGLLAERGVTVDEQSDARIRTCEDLMTLQRWVRRAVHATSAADLFEP